MEYMKKHGHHHHMGHHKYGMKDESSQAMGPYAGPGPSVMGAQMGPYAGPSPSVMGAQMGPYPGPGMGPQMVSPATAGPGPFGPTGMGPTQVHPTQVSPAQNNVNTMVFPHVVPHVHPSHTTNVNKHVFKHQHYFPQTQSTVNECYNQHLVCTGRPPRPTTHQQPCCPPRRPFGF